MVPVWLASLVPVWHARTGPGKKSVALFHGTSMACQSGTSMACQYGSSLAARTGPEKKVLHYFMVPVWHARPGPENLPVPGQCRTRVGLHAGDEH